MGRAIANRTPGLGFEDTTAFELLGDAERGRVERALSNERSRDFRVAADRAYLRQLAGVMAARTSAIDAAIREHGASELVILGAGLDGRAWRMPELASAIVFEVDHPDSQRDKRARVQSLRQTAREVRFVPVDFEHDRLDAALALAGHDAQQPTTWIWEGVVMYLDLEDIETTLRVVAARSAPGSRLVVLYHSPSPLLYFVGLLTRRLGEPLRSELRPAAMRALLARHGFSVTRDESMRSVGSRLGPAVQRMTRFVTHMRSVVAERN